MTDLLSVLPLPGRRRAVSDAQPAIAQPIAQWRSPARDLWVGATDDGRYVGMVERSGARYVSTDWASRHVGEHGSLAEAERALETLAEVSDLPSDDSDRVRFSAALAAGAGVIALALASVVALALPH
jgi:hypothetical protein